MAVAETFQSSSVFLKVCLILAPLGCLFQIIGVSTNYWQYAKLSSGNILGSVGIFSGSSLSLEFETHSGLWEGCVKDLCTSIKASEAWLDATRAFSIIGVITAAGTSLVIFACLFITTVAQGKPGHILATVLSFATVGSILLGAIIYGANYRPKAQSARAILTVITPLIPHWSFGICVAASILYIITGVMLVLNLLKKRQS